MPSSIVVAAIGASVAGTVTASIAAGAFTIGFSMASFASSLVLSGLSSALSSGRDTGQQQQQSSIANSGRTVTIRQAITAWRVIYGQTRVGGAVTYKKVTGDNHYYHMVITLAGHVCEEIGDIWFNDEVVPLDGSGNATGKYAGYVRIKKSLGTEAGQPFPDLVSESGGEWTDAHRQTGRTKIYVRIKASNDLFPTGIPNITAVVKGRQVYDPRTGLTAWSDNVALCVNDYLTDSVFGVGAVYTDEINAADLIASANVCDEAVSLAAGGTEKRYTCNGEFLVTEKPVDIIGKLTSAMAGYAVQIGPRWNIHAGAYEVPTIELTERDLAGRLEWQALVSRRDSCNAVKGIYVDPSNNWQPTDFPAIISAAYQAQDNGERVYHDLELNFTNSGTMAQRLAKIELMRTRQGLTVKFPGKLSCYRAKPGRTVKLTIAKYGWNAKPFFVSGGTFSINADGTLGYALALRETAAVVYDWSTSEEQAVDFAPNTDLGNPLTVETPSGLTISTGTSELFVAGDGTVISRIKASWTAPADAFVSGNGNAQLQYKKTADTAWVDAQPIPGALGPAWIAPVDDGAPYDVRVRFENSIGVRGAWATVTNTTVIGKSAPPADVTGFSVQQNGAVAIFRWDQVADADLAGYEIRYNPIGTTSWADATPITSTTRGTQITTAAVPPGSWTFLIKARDTSGNYSTNAARADLALANTQTVIASAQQAPDWLGTCTHFVRHWTGVLVPQDVNAASAYGWEVFDQFVPTPYATCTYDAPEFDLTIDGQVRIHGDIVSALGPGVTSGVAAPTLQVDYHTAAGVYDGFENWTVGNATCRYAKERISLDTTRGVAKIAGFLPTIDALPATQSASNVAVGAGGTAITFAQPYHAAPNVTANAVGTSALIATVSGVSATGFTLHIYNTASTEVGGTANWSATGV